MDKTETTRDRWYRGDQLPKVLDDAVSLAGGRNFPWFPSTTELKSAAFYVYPWSIYCHGVQPTGAELIFVRTRDKMVFYFGGKS
jgi:hypothetical protein